MADKMLFTKKQISDVFSSRKNQKDAEGILASEKKAEALVWKIGEKLKNIPVVGEYLADVPILCLMVSDYVKGNYKEVPFAAMVGIVVALVYFLGPVDLIPDAIPCLGQLDDAAVILFAVKAAHNDIADYKKWKGMGSGSLSILVRA